MTKRVRIAVAMNSDGQWYATGSSSSSDERGEVMAERQYSNGEIVVQWRSQLCTHCENCWRGLPAVFDPNARPWVNIGGATTEEIVSQVNQCPSGALSIERGVK